MLAKTKGVFKGGKVRFDPTVIQQKRTESMTPTEIARQVGCNPATVFRALRTNSPSGAAVQPIGRLIGWAQPNPLVARLGCWVDLASSAREAAQS